MTKIKELTGFIAENEIEELVEGRDNKNGGDAGIGEIIIVATAVSAALQSACPTSYCTKQCINH